MQFLLLQELANKEVVLIACKKKNLYKYK